MDYDLEYTPGDFTSPRHQHSSRELLLRQKFECDKSINPQQFLHRTNPVKHENYLKKKDQTNNIYSSPLPFTSPLKTPRSPSIADLCLNQQLQKSTSEMNTLFNFMTYKPNESCPSPIVPAYENFELAKRMHNENLDHQPLPDCVADLAYRKLQISGGQSDVSIKINPVTTGVGTKSYKIGPTHCTKLKVYRPKTCGVVPRAYDLTKNRTHMSQEKNKKMSAMDLAICWDYTPLHFNDELQRPVHIDGSNLTPGPAVFTHVKTPRLFATTSKGRSAGVFNNTIGEPNFFDKNILSRKTDFTGKNMEKVDNCGCDPNDFDVHQRANSVSRIFNQTMPLRNEKHYQSTPSIMTQQKLKTLREKYLGTKDIPICLTETTEPAYKQTGFFRRARTRLCQKVTPQFSCNGKTNFETQHPCKSAFRIGNAKYNTTGEFINSSSGCSFGSHNSNKVLVIPQPRNPYKHKNYSIDTLVPPFTSYQGGAREGGYPEHWRLASVYQHAYKPLAQRRKPLLHTVYK